ncbi:membrane protein insertase YidC [Nostocoides sp. HKS02]|uniref:membrane protein insertase YidC n=1 Tax=Nostocoides sp. HKS02 TaxID=1813880 RepID=UPI00351ADF8E
MQFYTSLIYPFEWIVSWILYGWHTLFTAIGIPSASGVAWVLSIVGLVVVMRAAMIPLFVRQIHASRRMQLIQPEMQKIQAKYKGKSDPESRQAMTQETMDLYKRTGTNPFSSCLPILLQSPFFFGLFRVLNGLKDIGAGKAKPIGPISQNLAAQAETSTLVRRPAVREVRPRPHPHGADHHRRADPAHVREHVHHPAPADDEEHAGVGAGQPVRQAAEDAALPDAACSSPSPGSTSPSASCSTG